MLRKIYIFFFFPFLNTLQEGEERRGVAARCSQVGSSKGATFFGNITSIWVVKKMKCANKKTKKPPNNKTVKSCNLSKIQLRKDCCTSPQLQYKLKTSWFHPTH